EHHHAAPVDLRLGTVVEIQRAEERVHAHPARVVRRLELVTLLEDVAAADAGEAGALAQRLLHTVVDRDVGARDGAVRGGTTPRFAAFELLAQALGAIFRARLGVGDHRRYGVAVTGGVPVAGQRVTIAGAGVPVPVRLVAIDVAVGSVAVARVTIL